MWCVSYTSLFSHETKMKFVDAKSEEDALRHAIILDSNLSGIEMDELIKHILTIKDAEALKEFAFNTESVIGAIECP